MPLKLKDAEAGTIENHVDIIPPGYIPIKLSSNGLFEVPNPIHIRNFRTEELVNLSITEESEIPELLISILNGMIFEDVDVGDWPDKCVIELVVRLYANYYSPILQSVPFPYTEEDLNYAEDHDMADIVTKIKTQNLFIPLDIRSVDIIPATPELKKYVTISPKDKSVSIKLLAYPRFGDVVQVQKYIKQKYKQQEKKFAAMQRALDTLGTVPDELYDQVDDYFEYVRDRTAETLRATKVLYLVSVDGVDYSEKPIEEKLAVYDSDPRLLDVNMSKIIDKEYKKFRFGIQPDIKVLNPITNEECVRRFSFRLLDILQAIKAFEPDGYDISYDD